MPLRYLACIASLTVFAIAPVGDLLAQSNHTLPPPDLTTVTVDFTLSDINGVNEADQTFQFEAVMTLHWNDGRLAFDAEEVGSTEKIFQGPFQILEIYSGWWPQLVLTNESGGMERQSTLMKISNDGSITYIEEVNAVAVTPMNLRRFPFDTQSFEIVFSVLGFTSDQLKLQAGSHRHLPDGVDLPQWRFVELKSMLLQNNVSGAPFGESIAFVVSMERNSAYVFRTVVVPLLILVMLSWSVFWMDRSSLGERMDISFVVILTVVAYQIIVSEHMPRIAYFTLMSSFLYTTYLMLAASVVVNLRVAAHDQSDREVKGDRLDRRCRWLFPLLFFGLNIGFGFVFLT